MYHLLFTLLCFSFGKGPKKPHSTIQMQLNASHYIISTHPTHCAPSVFPSMPLLVLYSNFSLLLCSYLSALRPLASLSSSTSSSLSIYVCFCFAFLLYHCSSIKLCIVVQPFLSHDLIFSSWLFNSRTEEASYTKIITGVAEDHFGPRWACVFMLIFNYVNKPFHCIPTF